MRLPLKTEYACQVMAQLARTHGSEKIRQVEELAQAEGLSSNYLVQILTALRQAGLVVSRRGKNGGYLLARPPEEITLADIAGAMEGAPLIKSSGGNAGMSSASVRDAWVRVNETVRECCAAIPLTELQPPEEGGAGGNWVI